MSVKGLLMTGLHANVACAARDWPGLEHLPEYQSLQRLDPYHDRLTDWCRGRFNSKEAFELLHQLFAYDPDSRLTAKEALQHRWFQEEPKPTLKYVLWQSKTFHWY